VKRRVDLIDQFADLVVGADDPRRLAERTLEVIMSLSNGRSGAVFTLDGGEIALFASRGIDQHVLDLAKAVWERHRDSHPLGQTFSGPARAPDARLPKAAVRSGPVSLAVVPVLAGPDVVALLYVDSLDPHFCSAHDLERLSKFGRIIAKAATDHGPSRGHATTGEAWETYLERTPVEDMEREKLLLLLNRNEWNIARVARLMNVTRRTIYLRLQRYNIPRERVPKTRPRLVRV
jgi:hypothetical protein